jgi:hypothetical protein
MVSNRNQSQAFRVLANPNVCINWTLSSIWVYIFGWKQLINFLRLVFFFLTFVFTFCWKLGIGMILWCQIVVHLSCFYTFHIYSSLHFWWFYIMVFTFTAIKIQMYRRVVNWKFKRISYQDMEKVENHNIVRNDKVGKAVGVFRLTVTAI